MFMLERNREIWEALPFFFLTLGCAIGSGPLEVLAIMSYFLLAKAYREPVWGVIPRTRIFWLSLLAAFAWLGALFFAWVFNHGDLHVWRDYVQRLIPFVLICVFWRGQARALEGVWLGSACGILFFVIGVLFHPVFTGDGRLLGKFSSPNNLADAIYILLPVTLFGIFFYRQKHRWESLFALFSYLLGATVVFFTLSRAGIAIVCLTFLLQIVFLAAVHDRVAVRIGAVLTVVAIVVLSVTPLGTKVLARSGRSLAVDGRNYLFSVSMDIYHRYPDTGIGLGRWREVYERDYEKPGREKGMASPHNIYLHTLNESGRVGLLGFCAMFLFQFVALLKAGWFEKRRSAVRWTVAVFLSLLGVQISGMVDYVFFERNMMHMFWLYWGVAVIDLIVHRQKSKERA